jgi:hypothetical protein
MPTSRSTLPRFGGAFRGVRASIIESQAVAEVTQILRKNGWQYNLKPHTKAAMKRWAFVVLGLYLLILVVLTVPVPLLAFAPKADVKNVVMTFIGLSLRISVMLFSYGPAVFFLYVDRWRRLHPAPAREMEQLA